MCFFEADFFKPQGKEDNEHADMVINGWQAVQAVAKMLRQGLLRGNHLQKLRDSHPTGLRLCVAIRLSFLASLLSVAFQQTVGSA